MGALSCEKLLMVIFEKLEKLCHIFPFYGINTVILVEFGSQDIKCILEIIVTNLPFKTSLCLC